MGHHILPKFYLNSFCCSDCPSGLNPCLWVYNNTSKNWKLKSPKHVTNEKDFYSFIDETGQKNDLVEVEVLQKIDCDASKIFYSKFNTKEKSLKIRERVIVSQFLAFLILRVYNVKNIIEESFNWIINASKRLKKDESSYSELMTEYSSAFKHDLSEILTESDIINANKISLQSLVLQSMFSEEPELTNILCVS